MKSLMFKKGESSGGKKPEWGEIGKRVLLLKRETVQESSAVDPDPRWVWSDGSAFKLAKITLKKEKVKKCTLFRSTGCSLFEGWRFPCTLDVLYGGPGMNIFFNSKIFSFLVMGSRIRIENQCVPATEKRKTAWEGERERIKYREKVIFLFSRCKKTKKKG